MSKPKILVVGCGAVGLSQGYYLSRAASITYLVRPGRRSAFIAPKNLYNYKTDTLHTFSDYRVIESTSEVSGEEFFCVLDTLDGHTARSEGGAATLRAVGDLIRDRPETFVAYDAVGLDIENYYAKTMRISKERFMMFMSMLAHQPTDSISIPPSANRDLVRKADMLYVGYPGNVGLMAFKKRPELARKFAELYDKNGELKAQFPPGFLEEPMPLLAMLHIIGWKIDGYQELQHLGANTELWNTMMKAQNEILTLPRLGWTGWLLSWVFGSWVTWKILEWPIEGAKPLVYREFNAFHHGNKVVKQDVGVLKDLIEDGELDGRRMPALREIVKRVDEQMKKTI